MAKARTTTATTVEEPIVEQNVETTAVVEEPQTVSEEPTENTTEGTTEEGNGENTSQTPVEGDNNGTTTEGTGEGTPQTPTDDSNGETTTEPSLEDKFVEMTGINKPYAGGIMNLPNFDYYIPVGSGVNLTERNELIADIKEAKNTTEGE